MYTGDAVVLSSPEGEKVYALLGLLNRVGGGGGKGAHGVGLFG